MSSPNAALRLLADQASRLQVSANDLPSQEESVQYWSGIGFVLAGVRYVAPMDEVAEVVPPPACTRIPGVCDWVNGVANVRGRLMAVMDLAQFLGQEMAPDSTRKRLLVVDEAGLYTGMMVDEVLGLQHFPITGRVERWTPGDTRVAAFVRGAYTDGGDYWPVFSLRQLVQDPHFLEVGVGS